MSITPGTVEIWATLGPSSLKSKVIKRLEQAGINLFRINLSHTAIQDIEPAVQLIRDHSQVPVCLDTEGAQIRTGQLPSGSLKLSEGAEISLSSTRIAIPAHIPLYPNNVLSKLKIGDLLDVDIDGALLQIITVAGDSARARVLHSGTVHSNRAVTVDRDIHLPPLTSKDQQAIASMSKLDIKYVALSFAHQSPDVEKLRNLVPDTATIISKIECPAGLDNLSGIIAVSDSILIDRGDLARQIPPEAIPSWQKHIIKQARQRGKPTYIATNLLETMTSSPRPSHAEINDVYNTLVDGAAGLVLAAETAVGNHPVACANTVRRLINYWQKNKKLRPVVVASADRSLIEPHGGILVQQLASSGEHSDSQNLTKLPVRNTDLMDCEQIAIGTFSPITAFMDEHTLTQVLDHFRLPAGEVWSLPITLQVPARQANNLQPGQRVALTNIQGNIHSLLDISEIYPVNPDARAPVWFGTRDRRHPGVNKLYTEGELFLAGKVTLVTPLSSAHQRYLLSPSQTRHIFSAKNWSRVVGFHTRNVPHRGHEYLQHEAMRLTGADGLYISPVIGPKKQGDWLTDPIILAYEATIANHAYTPNSVLLGSFSTYSRYAGPREGVFTALCRKNMGCSHFIVGRDHTGVGKFYGPTATHDLFHKLPDLGIKPVFFNTIGYNPHTKHYESHAGNTVTQPISGTEARRRLLSGKKLPEWFMRPQVQAVIHNLVRRGKPIFHGQPESIPALNSSTVVSAQSSP